MTRQQIILRTIMRAACLVVLALGVLLTPVTATCDHGIPHEYQVKAAFIYNFVRFTDWPVDAFESATAPICIAVVGHNHLGNAFSPFLDKSINGRKIVVVNKKETDPLDPCHVVFFTRWEHQNKERLLANLSKASVLTVGERQGFTQSGGMINFIIKDRRIRFEINPGAAERAGLKISSKLLQLATIVEQKGPKP